MDEKFMPIEKFYALKSLFENIWGDGTYIELKHCSDLKVWKSYCERTLRATQIAASDTVVIADEAWHGELSSIVEKGIRSMKAAQDFTDLFQYFAAMYAEISFHQLGHMPRRRIGKRSRLQKGNWRLDEYRSVQYVQNNEQKARFTMKTTKRETE